MKWLIQIVAIPYYFALLVACLIWLAVLCPLAFMTNCSVTNETNQALSITPIGTVGPDGARRTLPLYRTSFPYFVKSKVGDFQIGPNETLRFDYDMDDINFSEIVVENSKAEIRQVVANPNPTQNQYSVPEKTDFTIDNFSSLASVPENVATAAASGRQSRPFWAAYAISGILLVVEFLRLQFFKPKTETTKTQERDKEIDDKQAAGNGLA